MWLHHDNLTDINKLFTNKSNKGFAVGTSPMIKNPRSGVKTPHTVCFYYRDRALNDGSPSNQSIHAAPNVRLEHDVRGPVVLHAYNSEFMLHITPNTYLAAIDMFLHEARCVSVIRDEAKDLNANHCKSVSSFLWNNAKEMLAGLRDDIDSGRNPNMSAMEWMQSKSQERWRHFQTWPGADEHHGDADLLMKGQRYGDHGPSRGYESDRPLGMSLDEHSSRTRMRE